MNSLCWFWVFWSWFSDVIKFKDINDPVSHDKMGPSDLWHAKTI